jgi:hypothetical protein
MSELKFEMIQEIESLRAEWYNNLRPDYWDDSEFTLKDWQNVLDSQSASNIRALINFFPSLLVKIKADSPGTERHPAVILMLHQLIFLSHRQEPNTANYFECSEYVRKKIESYEK